MAQPFAVADYLAALLNLLPRGRVWPRDPGSGVAKTLTGPAISFQRLDAKAIFLLKDAFPATAVDLLPEWESTLGLPDPCAGPAPSIRQRQLQAVARLAQPGGQSVPFFIEYAAQLGFTITITEFTGARAHEWQVNVPASGSSAFTAGESVAGDTVDTISTDSAVLQCEFERLKPAQTRILWNWMP